MISVPSAQCALLANSQPQGLIADELAHVPAAVKGYARDVSPSTLGEALAYYPSPKVSEPANKSSRARFRTLSPLIEDGPSRRFVVNISAHREELGTMYPMSAEDLLAMRRSKAPRESATRGSAP